MLENRKFFAIYALLLVVVAGALMQVSALRIFGVAPNLLLVCLIVCSFFTEQIVFFTFLMLCASLSVRTTGAAFNQLSIATAVFALVVFWLQRRLVVRGFLGVSLLIGFLTPCVYLVIQPTFLWQYPGVVMSEIVYNAVVGFILFEITDRFFGKGIRGQ